MFSWNSNNHAPCFREHGYFPIDERFSRSLHEEAHKRIFILAPLRIKGQASILISIQLGIMSGRVIYPVNILRIKIFTAYNIVSGIYTRMPDMYPAGQIILRL